MTTPARVAPWPKTARTCYNRAVTPTWTRSSACSGGTCVEVAGTGSAVLLRDGKNPQNVPLAFEPADWADFLTAIKDGEIKP